MAKIKLDDQELEVISGGKLLDGWQNSVSIIMKYYKLKYGEEGKQKVKDMMIMSVNDPTSPVEPEDLDTLNSFIDENWDNSILKF